MMNLALKIAVNAGALWLAVWIVAGLDFEGSFWGFLLVSLFVVLANSIVKPILIIFSLPFIVVTLGLFLFITNALTLQAVVWVSHPDRLDLGLTSSGFFWATFFGAVVVSIGRWLIELTLGRALDAR
jgi:putative membrane protein